MSPTLNIAWPVSQAESGWSRLDVSAEGPSSSVLVVDRGALASLLLAVCTIATTAFFVFFGTSVRRSWLTLAALAVVLVMVPGAWVGFAQMALLSAVLAAILRLGCVVLSGGNGSQRKAKQQGRTSGFLRLSTWLLVLLGCFAVSAQSALAQRTIEQAAVDSTSPLSQEQIYGILIPVEQKVASSAGILIRMVQRPGSRMPTQLNRIEPLPLEYI